MDLRLNQYVEDLVIQALSGAEFAALSSSERSEKATQIRQTLEKLILDILVTQLNDEQIAQLQNLEPNSSQMEDKIEDWASQIPGLSQMIEEKLKQEVEKIQQQGLPS